MSMKKALDQTLRDIKRGVNKKVLKVPSVEQKVLDATSNEAWGPHGSLLSEISLATRNFHDYQIIMAVLWKRINDTGKNWRHVYKALTVLEYLVAHGSERVIDDIKEHAYQLATLTNFQYIDSSGRDQGNNVRRKSQSLVVLVNDKERIQEVREKASTNKDKFRSSSAAGGMYRPSSGGYGDDRYEGRYDDRNGNGRERDDDRYGRYGDSEDDSRGRSGSVDDYQCGSRSRSSDREANRAYDADDRHSSRGSSVKGEDNQNDGRPIERKFSEQNLATPPSYEDAVGVSRSPTYSERDGETPVAVSPPAVGAAAQSASPVADDTPQQAPSPNNVTPTQATVEHDLPPNHSNGQADPFDEFDPRGSVPVAQSSSHSTEMDLLGSLSDAFSPAPLAIMPASSGDSYFEVDSKKPDSDSTFYAVASENIGFNQSFEDPFGDSPFKAIPSDEPSQPHNFTSAPSFQSDLTTSEHTNYGTSCLEFPNSFPGSTPFNPADVSNTQIQPSQQFPSEEQSTLPENDILAGILPPSGPFPDASGQPPSNFGFMPQSTPPTSQISFPDASSGQPPSSFGFMPQSAPPASQVSFPDASAGQPPSSFGFMPQSAPPASQVSFPDASAGQPPSNFGFMPQSAPPTSQVSFPDASTGQPPANFGFMPQSAPPATSFHHMASQNLAGQSDKLNRHDSLPYSGQPVNSSPYTGSQAHNGTSSHQNDNLLGGFLPHSSSTGSLDLVPHQPLEKKFETKSTVWADTLNRGLVNLNISGSKINPLSDIGIDFESLNRKEKRMEMKPSTTQATSTVSMGKAMGSGSGMGRAGAGALRPAPNQMMPPNMGGMPMGMGGGGVGMGMVNYGQVNQQPMGMGMGGGMGMGINMGMGQRMPMQPPMGQGMPPPMQQYMGQPPQESNQRPNMNNYPMMGGTGSYPPQQTYQYGGGY